MERKHGLDLQVTTALAWLARASMGRFSKRWLTFCIIVFAFLQSKLSTLAGRLVSKKISASVDFRDIISELHGVQSSNLRRTNTSQIILCSPGGTGSSSGFKWFRSNFGLVKDDMNSELDSDFLKHQKYDSLMSSLNKLQLYPKLIVFQFDDPVQAIFSLFRREYQHKQAAKLRGSYPNLYEIKGLTSHLENMTSYARVAERDLLGFHEQFESYVLATVYDTRVPLVFLRTTSRDNPAVIRELKIILKKFHVHSRPEIVQKTLPLNVYPRCAPSFEATSIKYKNESNYNVLARSHVYTRLRQAQEKLGSLSLAYAGEIVRLVC